MNLPTLILTVLRENTPMSGYDIHKQLKESWNSFWTASHQQVYRELKTMKVNSLVADTLYPQDGKPDRIVYSITQSGRQKLIETAQQDVQMDKTRDKLAIQLLANSNDIEGTKAHIVKYLELIKAQFDEIQEQRSALESQTDPNFTLQMILDKQATERKASIEWAENALKQLDG